MAAFGKDGPPDYWNEAPAPDSDPRFPKACDSWPGAKPTPMVEELGQVEVRTLKVDVPEAFDFLFEKARYKVCYGGRGAGRSWSYARALLARAYSAKTRIVCLREIQQSIKDSIHRLLSDQIELLGLQDWFTITDTSILGRNGSEFIFSGLYRNVNKIKSLEGIDIADVEEAESVSDESWQVLLPTIRKPGSEVWIRFNTKYTDDATYKRFVTDAPKNAIVRLVNWDRNPFFPEELKKEKDQDYAMRPHEAKNIWGGEPIGYGRKVWPDFETKVHLRDFEMQLVADRGNCFMAMDPAQHYYPACLWMAVIPKNTRMRWPEDFWKWIYAEWPTKATLGTYFHEARKKILFTGTLADMAREIYLQDGTGSYGIKIVKRGIDTRFAKGSGASNYFSGQTLGLVGEFAKKENGGVIFDMPSEKIIDVQKDLIHKDFQYNHLVPITVHNEPNLFISPRCENLVEALKNHRLEEGSEREAEKYKDFSDTLRLTYATIADFRYNDPTQREQKGTHEYVNPEGFCGTRAEQEGMWMG
jgi:hypothetical protein